MDKKETTVDPLVTAFNYYLKEKVLTPAQAENLAKLMLEIAQLHQLKEMQKSPSVAALYEIKEIRTKTLRESLNLPTSLSLKRSYSEPIAVE